MQLAIELNSQIHLEDDSIYPIKYDFEFKKRENKIGQCQVIKLNLFASPDIKNKKGEAYDSFYDLVCIAVI